MTAIVLALAIYEWGVRRVLPRRVRERASGAVARRGDSAGDVIAGAAAGASKREDPFDVAPRSG